MPLQKSYSERVGLTKRSPWQRSRSNPVNFGHQNSSRPLEPISEKTKTKLSKFQYNKPAVDLAGDEPASKDGKPMVAEGQVEGGEGGNAVTPAPSKFSWRELVEPGVSVEEDGHKSPNERIMWDTANKPTTLSPMMLQRKGKKRARSSSPVSSPAKETHTTPTVNVKKLTAAFKSPYADPTLELWDRYSFHRSGATTPVKGMTNPAMAQLMVSSSPQPAAAARPKANLRRSISHGLNWPKRRKIDKTKSYSNSNEEQREMEAASKSSLVTALLDTVTDTFSGMGEEDAVDHPMRSPSRNKRDLKPRAHSPSPAPTKAAVQPIAPASSDYGDDDFDDDMFLEMEAVVTATQAAKPETPPAEASKVTDETSLLGDFEDLDDDDIFDDVQGLDSVSPSAQRQRALPPPKTLTPKKPKPAPNGVDDSNGLDADFSDLDDEDIDFDAVELAATQSAKTQEHDLPTARKKTIQRYLVTNVLDGEFVDDRGATRMEKILLIQADGSKVMKTVLLRGSWFDTPAHAESYVHVIGDFDNRGRCIVDDAHNLLILHPDQLISATVVADSFGCMRRAVLQDRVKATSEAAPPLVYGTILHEIFQEALMANNWDRAFLSKVIERTTEKHLEDLYTIKVSLAIAREHLESKMAEVTHWASTFVAAQPQREATVEGRGGDKLNMAVTKLLDVEEHVWSPMYGLKGNIDATIEVAMTNGKKTRNLTVPFEVKTGKHANSNHMAQTALYTLLLSDRYDIEIAYGILYYMETSKTMQIPAVRHELRHMIMQRNQLACYVRERSVQLPPMLRNKHMCGKCYAKTSCFVYHRLADDGDGETSNMKEKFDELVHHLTPRHQEFFIKWENLLTKEEKESQKNKRELWTMTSHEREKKSRCFADVIIEEGSASVDSGGPRINRFHYTFVKRIPIPGFSFLESELNVGEPIVVSDEEGHFALAIGYITSVKKNRVTVAVDRRLHNARTREPGFDEEDNQAFASIMRVAAKGSTQQNAQGKTKEPLIRYRLDQDEFSNGMATVRNNLVQMMANDVPQAPMTRKLVVDLVAPRFKDIATQYSVTDGESLNVDQKKAIEKVMSAQDYALVLGMPGTGKTTTIAHIIRALVSQGKSVLLTSHTHTAVDNILLKLKTDNIPILRLGAPAKVHPEVHDFVNLASLPKSSFDEIRDSWHGTPIVATTCLGINHHVFNERSFDYCIVDEASQITLPICAGPIRMAKTFVLVGDHNQLPPVVKNEEARLGGLDVSLFKLLSDTHPQSVVNLEHQYRMCEDIMTLSNTLIYEGRLRCGFEALKKRKLDVPNMGALRYRHYDAASITQPGTPLSFCTGGAPSRCWLYDLLEGEARVRFVNTDTLQPAVREEAHGKRIVNSAEVRIVSQLVDSLITVGVPSEEIGVMTHYRSQLFMLKDELKGRAGVEMHTTDRFQGRDKEVIVLSLVRSNDACNIGDLLKDWRRINVAFTRAKTKLLVVGSVGTLRGSGKENMLSKFITLMEGRDWIYDLPADALLSHHFDDLATQTTTTGLTPKAKTPRRMGLSPKKMMQGGGPAAGKENRRPSPKRATIGDRALLRGKPIMRDILNEMTNGAY